MKRCRIVPHDIQAATFCWPTRAKCRDDHVPARLDRRCYLPHIRSSIFTACQKMKHCTVMPNVVSAIRKPRAGDVCRDPIDMTGARTQPLSRDFQRFLRDIHDRNTSVSSFQQIIHQGRFTATNVDDRRRLVWARTLDKPDGFVQMRAIPANRLRCLGLVDRFPMGFVRHGHLNDKPHLRPARRTSHGKACVKRSIASPARSW